MVVEEAEVRPDLTVLILSFNVCPYLRLALRTARAARRALDVEILVVDNASTDGSAEMVEGEFPDIRLIRSGKNVGFAAGNNLGLKVARGRHVLLMNPDVLVHPDAFEALVAYLDAHPEVGAAGGRIINPDGTSDPGARRGFPSPSAAFYRMVGLSYFFPQSKRFGRYNMRYLREDQETAAEALSGCFMCVRREVLEQVGGLDEQFFLYGEDLDWSYRMASAGWKLAYVPSAEIVHFKGKSTRSLPRHRQLYEFHRAMHIFVKKHIAPRRGWPVKAVIEAGILLSGIGVSLWRLVQAAFVPAVDFAALGAGLCLAILIRMRFGEWSPPGFSTRQWFLVGAVFAGSGVGGALVAGLHGPRRLDVRRAAIATVIGGTACIVAIFLIRSINFSRMVTGITWCLTAAITTSWRWLAQPHRGEGEGGWLVLGCGRRAESLFRALTPNRRDYRVIGVVRGRDDSHECAAVQGYPVIGDLDDLPLLLRTLKPSELIVAWERYQYSDLLSLARRGGRYPRRIRLVPDGLPTAAAASPEEWPLIDLDLHKRTWL